MPHQKTLMIAEEKVAANSQSTVLVVLVYLRKHLNLGNLTEKRSLFCSQFKEFKFPQLMMTLLRTESQSSKLLNITWQESGSFFICLYSLVSSFFPFL